jgi:hypothetical protein
MCTKSLCIPVPSGGVPIALGSQHRKLTVIGLYTHACTRNELSSYAAKESSWGVSASTTGSTCTLTNSAAVTAHISSMSPLAMVKYPRNVFLSVAITDSLREIRSVPRREFCRLRVAPPHAKAIVAKEFACERSAATSDPQCTLSSMERQGRIAPCCDLVSFPRGNHSTILHA